LNETGVYGKNCRRGKRACRKGAGVSKDKIIFTVIEEPKKGLFGKIKGEARILAEYEPTKGEIAGNYIKAIISKMGSESEVSVKEEDGGALMKL
jgi:spoIIIJ-associated protein